MAGRANEVIARFGGQSALARALRVNQSTVQHWSKTGQIPSWREDQIERVAEQQGVMVGDLGSGARQSVNVGGAQEHGRGARRAVTGYARAAAPVQPLAPMIHGRADMVIHADREIGALREEIGQLRAVVEKLVGEVSALRELSPAKRTPSKRKAARVQRAEGQAAGSSKRARS